MDVTLISDNIGFNISNANTVLIEIVCGKFSCEMAMQFSYDTLLVISVIHNFYFIEI